MTKQLVRRLSAIALMAIPFGTASADLVLVELDLNSGQGFGNANTIFTLQVTGGNQTAGTQIEQGCYAFGDVTGAFNAGDNSVAGTTVNAGNFCTELGANQVASGSPKNALPSLAESQITSVSQIGLLLNLNQVSTQGITVNDLVLSFYTSTGDVLYTATLPNGFCTIASLCSGTDTFLSSIPGQGGSGYVFVLNATQQAALLAAMGGTFNGNILVGASASFGCSAAQTANCKEANSGAESLSLAQVTTATITPEPSTTALLATGLVSLVGMLRRRRRQV